jgi:hypothetical protein
MGVKNHENSSGNLMKSQQHEITSRHVKSFSNIRIDLLWYIVLTVATSHWMRSRLKMEAERNTVARKEGRLHSQSTRKKKRRKNPAKKANIVTSHHHHQPKPPTELSNHNRISSRHVKSFSTIRIDLLDRIVSTFATSHLLRSPLKA